VWLNIFARKKFSDNKAATVAGSVGIKERLEYYGEEEKEGPGSGVRLDRSRSHQNRGSELRQA